MQNKKKLETRKRQPPNPKRTEEKIKGFSGNLTPRNQSVLHEFRSFPTLFLLLRSQKIWPALEFKYLIYLRWVTVWWFQFMLKKYGKRARVGRVKNGSNLVSLVAIRRLALLQINEVCVQEQEKCDRVKSCPWKEKLAQHFVPLKFTWRRKRPNRRLQHCCPCCLIH